MRVVPPLLAIDQSCKQVQVMVCRKLSSTGCQIRKTFDLQTARLPEIFCDCSNNGIETRECQLIVLLVYGELDIPITLILQGVGGRTFLSLVKPLGQSCTQQFENKIRHLLSTIFSTDVRSLAEYG